MYDHERRGGQNLGNLGGQEHSGYGGAQFEKGSQTRNPVTLRKSFLSGVKEGFVQEKVLWCGGVGGEQQKWGEMAHRRALTPQKKEKTREPERYFCGVSARGGRRGSCTTIVPGFPGGPSGGVNEARSGTNGGISRQNRKH